MKFSGPQYDGDLGGEFTEWSINDPCPSRDLLESLYENGRYFKIETRYDEESGRELVEMLVEDYDGKWLIVRQGDVVIFDSYKRERLFVASRHKLGKLLGVNFYEGEESF